jgi:adenylate cyclase
VTTGTTEPESEFARALSREILASEVLRAKAVAATLIALVAIVTVSHIIGHEAFQRFATKPLSWWLTMSVSAPFIAYEFVFIYVMSRFAARGRMPPRPARYANAIIETSLPTVILLVASHYAEPNVIFGGWPSFLYFLLIVASTLRLNFALPMVTGAVAAVEYMGVVAHVLPLSFAANDVIMIPLYHAGRAMVMLLAGLVAGLVAMRLRANFVRALEESAARERVTNLFGQHVSPAVVERLLDSKIVTEGEAREVCVMFVDIRDFTAFTRQRTPAEVVTFLNGAFGFMVEAVDRNHGIVNKFLGDGFMAVFGAPLPDPNAATNAVIAAREILSEIGRRAAGEPPLRVGFGLHVGIAMTGNIGSPRRKEFTVIGDTVNLAARIEQLNKELRSQLLVSDAMAAALGPDLGDATRHSVTVKGYAEPITVWQLA